MKSQFSFLILVSLVSVSALALSPDCASRVGYSPVSVQGFKTSESKDIAFQPTYVQISPLAMGMPGELVFDVATQKLSLRMFNWQQTFDCKTQGNECANHLAGMRDDLKSFRKSVERLSGPAALASNLAIVDCAMERVAEFETAIAPVHQP